jgi:hypothetical protein
MKTMKCLPAQIPSVSFFHESTGISGGKRGTRSAECRTPRLRSLRDHEWTAGFRGWRSSLAQPPASISIIHVAAKTRKRHKMTRFCALYALFRGYRNFRNALTAAIPPGYGACQSHDGQCGNIALPRTVGRSLRRRPNHDSLCLKTSNKYMHKIAIA